MKRQNYIDWDEYFMATASLAAMRSKDPRTQVGACVVNKEKKVVGIGYNGMPNGCDDDHLPWVREAESGSFFDTKYPYVVHAEMNAIANKNCADIKGCILYTTHFPCNECAKLIIQSGIVEIVFLNEKSPQSVKTLAAKRIFNLTNTLIRQFEAKHEKLVINLKHDI